MGARRGRVLVALAATVLLGAPGALLAPGSARADESQRTILVDDALVLANPTATLTQARALGVTTLRLDLPWGEVAPASRSFQRPNFDQADPAAYPSAALAPYDTAIREADQLGITVDLDLAPGAPLWATGPGQPHNPPGYPHWQWEPNALDFGAFAQAMGERYSGNWNPLTAQLDPGNPADLPRVPFWSIWNEPNYDSLAPQALPGHHGVQDSPRIYRDLVDAAWSGLASSGHTTPRDTIIIGELAPRSELTTPEGFGDFNGMTPMMFLENMYCLTPAFRPLRGRAATLRGCPASAAGSRRFIAGNPALFDNSGVSDHPYDEWFAPDQELDLPRLAGWALENTQDTSLATIGVLERGLDRLTAAYGDHEQLPIWDTEYGYQTSPPHRRWKGDERPWPSPARAAYYDNWAEYLHWRNPRIRSFCQYLLQDGPSTRADDYGAFASGLIADDGIPKADYAAFRMPLYLPRTRAASGQQPLQIWGAVRPAAFAPGAVGQPAFTGAGSAPSAAIIQFRRRGEHRWSTLAIGPLNAEGYYDIRSTVPADGTLRAEWIAPPGMLDVASGAAYDSRSVTVTVG